MLLTAKRTQWPVGQGNFSSGKISLDKAHFEYVYDCGANDKSALKSACAALRPAQDMIDAVFLSHLDSDHVNGVDILATANGYTITNLFLPYLTDVEAIMLLASELAADSLTGDFVAFLQNPISWSASRGVSRVFFIGRGRDREDPESESPEDRPDPRERRWQLMSSPGGEESKGNRLELSVSCKPSGTPADGKGGIEWASYPGKVSFAVGTQRIPEWYLIPWVPPLPRESIKEFLTAIKSANLRIQPGNLTSRKLLDIVRDRKLCKTLKSCYQLLATNHNYVSMCLYSGPYLNKAKAWIEIGFGANDRSDWLISDDRAGWLGTGDAPLKVPRIYDSFYDKYERFLPCVSTLMCPHHGSRHNFNSQLLVDASPTLCFASHGEERPYGHPHAEVVRQINGYGMSFCSVTEEPMTRIIEQIRFR